MSDAEDQEDVAIMLPDRQLDLLGITEETAAGYPVMKSVSDKLAYGILENSRRNLVGRGTNLQMIEVLGEDDRVLIGQICLYLVKNQIKPMISDLVLLVPLVQETARLLGQGDMHAVNRRRELRQSGVLTATGIVPRAVRAEWLRDSGYTAARMSSDY